MKFRLTPETAVSFVRGSVFLVCSWPPNPKVKNSELYRFQIQWWIVFFILLFLLLPLLNGIWVYRHNFVIIVKIILMSSATAQALLKIIICKKQRPLFQELHTEMEVFIKKAEKYERQVLERYVNRCGVFYGFVTICVYLACLAFIVEPLLIGQPFPTDSAFPFPTSIRPIYEIIYIQQSIAIFHIAAALSIDNQVALLFWYTGARFEMIGNEIKNTRNEKDILNCIKKHQMVLILADKVKQATRFVALITALTTTIGIICGGLTLVSNQPFSVKLRVCNLVFNASLELFIYSWPADNLIETSQAIGNHAYNSAWLEKPRSVQKMLINIIQRSHKAVTISVGGFLPSLSLHYYASFLSSAFSYFSTMRIVYTADSNSYES